MESAEGRPTEDRDKLMKRIEMIDTEAMLLGKIWQAGEDKIVNGRSVCLTRVMELQAKRKEIESAMMRGAMG